MIEVRNLMYNYPGVEAYPVLRGVSFSMKPGERIAVIGPNGSGKTTFVRCLNALLLPQTGTVSIDGLKTSDGSALYEIRRRVGMVFQNPDNQTIATSVERELAFGLENLGMPREKMIPQVEEALQLFHLSQYRRTPPHLLSGGERQRLALAAIWIMKPTYIVMDEPTSLLDPQSRMEIYTFLSQTLGKEQGLLLVTQLAREALLCDRLIVFHEGRILFDDAPDTVFSDVKQLTSIGLDVPTEYELKAFCREEQLDCPV